MNFYPEMESLMQYNLTEVIDEMMPVADYIDSKDYNLTNNIFCDYNEI